jgi:hypothetical protein
VDEVRVGLKDMVHDEMYIANPSSARAMKGVGRVSECQGMGGFANCDGEGYGITGI